LSESPYPSNYDLLNNYIVPKYFVSPQCSYVSLANISPVNFGKRILSESPYPSNSDLLNNYVAQNILLLHNVPRVSLANLSLLNFGKIMK
jgi:hypothetical protein